MKEINTKKIIALAVIGTICLAGVWQAYWTKEIPTDLIALGGTITGFYFGYGKGKSDAPTVDNDANQ